jgi:hypothetical protein
MARRYLSTLPTSVNKGRVLMHSHATHTVDMTSGPFIGQSADKSAKGSQGALA